jgi:hypothetical protein
MSWTAPTPPQTSDGPLAGVDRPILESYLDFERSSLLNICAGLTGERLVERSTEPSGLSLLGIVRHLAKVERIWFRQRVGGEDVPPLFDPSLGKDADFERTDPDRAAEDFEVYAREVALARAAAADHQLEDTFELRGDTCSLRFVYVHMIAEYSRHNGHADLIRERLDGSTGR